MKLDRDDFTRHGKHLNVSGKVKVAKIIGQNITELLTKQENNTLHSRDMTHSISSGCI
jgi:hypothetical protein